MPWKDKNKQLEARRKSYRKNSKKEYARIKARRSELRNWYIEYKSTLSCSCGENHIACLDFHHPGRKDKNISTMIRNGYSQKRILAEIQKCVVLCSNCHRKLHYKQI